MSDETREALVTALVDDAWLDHDETLTMDDLGAIAEAVLSSGLVVPVGEVAEAEREHEKSLTIMEAALEQRDAAHAELTEQCAANDALAEAYNRLVADRDELRRRVNGAGS